MRDINSSPANLVAKQMLKEVGTELSASTPFCLQLMEWAKPRVLPTILARTDPERAMEMLYRWKPETAMKFLSGGDEEGLAKSLEKMPPIEAAAYLFEEFNSGLADPEERLNPDR